LHGIKYGDLGRHSPHVITNLPTAPSSAVIGLTLYGYNFENSVA